VKIVMLLAKRLLLPAYPLIPSRRIQIPIPL
jgi:hypothetical protein